MASRNIKRARKEMEMVSLIAKIALADSYVATASVNVSLSSELYEKLINDEEGYCVFWGFMENMLRSTNRISNNQKLLSVDEMK